MLRNLMVMLICCLYFLKVNGNAIRVISDLKANGNVKWSYLRIQKLALLFRVIYIEKI